MERWIVRAAFALVSLIVLYVSAHGQFNGGGGGGGGGGTPCTTTANSLQYNNAGSFGCATKWLYNSSKASLGDGSNFQTYWDAGQVALRFRNAADNDNIPIFATSYLFTGGGSLNNNYLGFPNFSSNGAFFADPGWRGSMNVVDFGSGAGMSWSTTANPNSGTYDTGIARNAAGVVEVDNGTAGTLREVEARSYVSGGSVPTLSGCSATTQTGGGTVGSYTSGTTGTCTVTLTFSYTAPTGWSCWANDLTTVADTIKQSGVTNRTTTATFTGTTVSGDVINYGCIAY